jgi:hypothetical protein
VHDENCAGRVYHRQFDAICKRSLNFVASALFEATIHPYQIVPLVCDQWRSLALDLGIETTPMAIFTLRHRTLSSVIGLFIDVCARRQRPFIWKERKIMALIPTTPHIPEQSTGKGSRVNSDGSMSS